MLVTKDVDIFTNVLKEECFNHRLAFQVPL
jgi:hypothetical protein